MFSVTGTVTEPAAELTVTELLLYPGDSPDGLTVTVIETGGPDGTEPGVPVTVTQLSAAVTEVMPREPPPEF
jgi:hypothetical protein